MVEVSGVIAKPGQLERHCLVTIGATARFPQLLEEIGSLDFLNFLSLKGYTHLHVQCGIDLEIFKQALEAVEVPSGLAVLPFSFVDDLRDKMVLCRGESAAREQGVIISHAGTGTVLDAWRVHSPLIVVPNPTLKDDHQTELAQELQRQGYAIWGRLGQLTFAMEEVDGLREEQQNRWRPNSVSETLTRVDVWGIGNAMVTRYMTDAQLRALKTSNKLPTNPPQTETVVEPEAIKEEAARMALD